MLTTIALTQFVQLINEYTGIRIPPYQMDLLRQTLLQIAASKQINDAQTLLNSIHPLSNPTNPHWQTLINALTIGESNFFRDAARSDFLKLSYLPQLIARKSQADDLNLRIWSAGCAQGQELYTIAMLLEPLLGEQKNWTIDLVGTDINSTEIEAALSAKYSSWSMRTMEPFYQRCYFSRQKTAGGTVYQLSDTLKKNTRFFKLNLQDPIFSTPDNPLENVDLILCCNVFIYFDPKHIPPVLAKMAHCLNDDGTLVLAAADYPYDLMDRHFTRKSVEEYHYFVKNPLKMPSQSRSKNPSSQSGLKTLNQVVLPTSTLSTSTAVTPSDAILVIQQHMSNAQWTQAITTIKNHWDEGADKLMMYRYHANALANLGDLSSVMDICRQGLTLYPEDKILYLLSALACSGQSQLAQATEALHKALFIDPAFIDAHYHLALLALKQGNKRQAEGCLQTALKLCKQREDDEMTCLYPQTAIAAFKDTLQRENLK